ncbi:carbon-nitrogen hydrolase family protein [Kribbella sp. NPDC048915]|uniref:carbon-nitrogen hydrolase family protein n=1 Tax=Kribbella sp. NPDC048915 TaxID=3155148 RepID=UPI0033E11A8D
MTAHRNFKQRVRARAAKTGESYTAALRHFRPTPTGEPDMPENLRIAVTQSTVREDPTDAALLRTSGDEVRRLMREAAAAGARLVHFTEGAICFPSKRVMSSLGPDQIGPSDWTKADWAALQAELDQIAALSRELGLWTVIPSVHRVADGRPYNSMYVVSDRGRVVARYDERALSTTKATWMYAAGNEPVTFEVDGVRFGLALGLDVLFPEFFTEYDRLGADVVLVSYASNGVGRNENIGVQVRGASANNTSWVSLAASANPEAALLSGVSDPGGQWLVQCAPDATPSVAVAELTALELTTIGRDFRRRTRERIGS